MADKIKAYEDKYWWSNDGLQLHYRDYPASPENAHRPPIICLHGLTRNARDFEDVALRLKGEWRLICVDFRGRGESAYAKDPLTYVPLTYMQDMEALLIEQKIEKFVAFGRSLGGVVTMLLSMANPHRLAGVMLNDIGPEISTDGVERIKEYVGSSRNYATWMHAGKALQELHGHVYPHFDISDWISMAKRNMKLSSSGKVIYDYDMKIAEPLGMAASEADMDLWPLINGLKHCPGALLRGETSDILSPDTAAKMLDNLPHMRLTTVPGVGHAPLLDEDKSSAAIDDLLLRVDAYLAEQDA